MTTLTRRFAWLPREPQPTPLSDKAVQIVNILQRAPNGLTASEIVKKSGGTFLVNHVYVYLRRLQARGIVHVSGPEPDAKDPSRQVLRAVLAPGQVVKRQKPGEAAQAGATRSTRAAATPAAKAPALAAKAPAGSRAANAAPPAARGARKAPAAPAPAPAARRAASGTAAKPRTRAAGTARRTQPAA